jgi:Beta-L-arabinofuranosidase, GH127
MESTRERLTLQPLTTSMTPIPSTPSSSRRSFLQAAVGGPLALPLLAQVGNTSEPQNESIVWGAGKARARRTASVRSGRVGPGVVVLAFFLTGGSVGTRGGEPPAPRIPPAAVPVSLSNVRMLDGPFQRSQAVHARYLLSLEPDRLLARFRLKAGLPPRAANYPGWEDKELPGVAAGFYLSGCSQTCTPSRATAGSSTA